MPILGRISNHLFNLIHGRNLVYNTCWEDPRIDRAALSLGPQDTILVITSAGCNALDYALAGVRKIYAVDLNPRQNALLELKLAGIEHLDFETFFKMFGEGRLTGIRGLYSDKLRPSLSPFAQTYWDRNIKMFAPEQGGFYFHGTSGQFARLINGYLDHILRARPVLQAILAAETLEEQRRLYHTHLREQFWTHAMRFFIGRDATLSLLGVPKAQRRQVESQYEGGIIKFVRDCMDAVFEHIPMVDNYFWRVYMTGRYSRKCCPEYLKPHNFQGLKSGLVDCIRIHTDSVEDFLRKNDVTISRYVLLDHMDWLAGHRFHLLESEWQAIVDKAAPGARILWRSGGLRTDYVDRAQVRVNGCDCRVGELLTYYCEMAHSLHRRDRVHTYGSFYIADLGV